MKKGEYTQVRGSTDMNDYGQEGGELCGVDSNDVFYYKREIIE